MHRGGRDTSASFSGLRQDTCQVTLASWCLTDSTAISGNNNNLLFHRAGWSLSCGYYLGDPQAERGVLSERAYLHLRPCLTSSKEQELLIAVSLYLVWRAAAREGLTTWVRQGGPAVLFLSPNWIRTPLKISQTFPAKPRERVSVKRSAFGNLVFPGCRSISEDSGGVLPTHLDQI